MVGGVAIAGAPLVGMDGSGKQELYNARYRQEGTAYFTELRALSDDETNLFIQRRAGEEPERIEALDKRVSDVAVDPEGTQIAVSRHADFDLPTRQQVNDNRILLIDINEAGSAMPIVLNELEPEADETVWRPGYSHDGATLYAATISTTWRINPSTGEREVIDVDGGPWNEIYPNTTHRERCEALRATLEVRAEDRNVIDLRRGQQRRTRGR